ncbi:MAG: TIGR00341 family protein [Candidatus Moranbacteria bacterium]|nr:TIGR00341 family protein [Candidatus Moranbacteria bacterium]
MVLVLFNNLTEKDKSRAIDNLISESTPRQDFFLLVILSILMATFGLLTNSAAVIIGSMLIAPILYPILSLSLGIVIADFRLISRSFYTLVKSIVFGVSASALTTIFFKPKFFNLETEEARLLFSEILSRTEPTIIYGAIAVVAGLAASFALIKPHLSETLPGTAISVALIPPLAVTGIGIATLDWNIISNSFMLFMVNTIGIIFASMIVFSLMHLYIKREEVRKVITRESGVMEKEIEKAKKEHERED